jgi:TnpA family transposase
MVSPGVTRFDWRTGVDLPSFRHSGNFVLAARGTVSARRVAGERYGPASTGALHRHAWVHRAIVRPLLLLGYSFMPRLRDLADQQLYKVDRTLPLDTLQPLVHSGVDLDLILEQWDQLVRVAASLRNRVVPAHVVLQRLSGASPSDRVAKALTTLGRIVKTIFILRYIHEEKIRRRVQLQLNRGEARHELARWLFFANRVEFRTGD